MVYGDKKMNEILLRRKNKVILESVQGAAQVQQADNDMTPYITTMMKNVEGLGYTFSRELYDALHVLEKTELEKFYLELISILKKMVGADVVYQPMYPNFPESVMNEQEAQLYFNAIVHYWSFGMFYPNERKEERLPLFDSVKVKVIDLGKLKDLEDIFLCLCHSRTSLSQSDKEDLEWIFKNLQVSIPEDIPLKENVALIGKLYLENAPLASAKELRKLFRTATDVLRLITAMSQGDISLTENTKYRSFRRRERRLLLELLQGCGQIDEDMNRYREKWIRVGERLHPGEYKEAQFGKVQDAFGKLRNHIKIETFAGKLEQAMGRADYQTALDLLRKRPGEFARKLDRLLRCADNKNMIINTFKDVAGEVSTPVLLQVREHFLHRSQKDARVFFPKGNLARSHYIENVLPEIEEKYCSAIVRLCENALLNSYKEKDFLGNVYLSEEFRRYLVPFSQRSAGKTLKSVVRGSRMPVAENVCAFRGFIWWTNMKNDENDGRVDIDLSAAIFDENFNYLEHISYTNLRSEKYRACHSGDIVNGGSVNGSGVSEFLDVDVDSVVGYGGRYVVFQVYSFTGQQFCDIPRVMFGWMGRQDVKSGEIYAPTTVEQKMDLAARSRVCIPVIFDCKEREIIWCDMSLSLGGCRANNGGNNVESNLSGVAATCYGIVHAHKPNLYDLIDLHIKARGVRVENKEEADIVFDLDSGITPFDTEVFMGEYI